MKLSKVQNSFQDHIIRKGKDIDDDFAIVCETGKIPLEERMKVYRDNIIGGLTITLADTFPTVRAICGEEFTLGMFQTYIRQNLPKSGWLEEYGVDIPEFIEEFEPAKQLSYLPDMARLDWYRCVCEHDQDDRPLKPEHLQDIKNFDLISLRLRTSAYLLKSEFPIMDIYDFTHDQNNENQSPPDLKSGPSYVLIYRPYLKAETIRLEKSEYDFLSKMEKGISISNVLENILEEHKSFDFNHFFQKFFSYETFREGVANA